MDVLTKQHSVKGPEQWCTGEEHWHGAAADHFMTHIALWEGDDTAWAEHVSDGEYPTEPV
jgi:hypothetical protein